MSAVPASRHCVSYNPPGSLYSVGVALTVLFAGHAILLWPWSDALLFLRGLLAFGAALGLLLFSAFLLMHAGPIFSVVSLWLVLAVLVSAVHMLWATIAAVLRGSSHGESSGS